MGERSGMPVLLNTSLNIAGEPIVCSAAEGYSTFRRSGIDVLVAGDDAGREARARRGGARGGIRMIPRRGRFRRSLTRARQRLRLDRPIWPAACGAAAREKRLVMPLAIFLCVTGFLLILAAGVEALAPFIYSIF